MFNRPILKNYAKTGRGQQVATIPWLSVDFDAIGTSASGFALGSTWYDDFGNEFQLKFNSAAGALVRGDLVEWETVATDTTTIAAVPAPTTRQFALVAGFGGVANFDVGSFLFNETDGTVGFATLTDCLKPVKANTVSGAGELITVSLLDTKVSNLQPDADAYAAAPVAADPVTIIRPYQTCVFPIADAATGRAVGVATGPVPASNFYMAQVGGLALTSVVGGVLFLKGTGLAHSAATPGAAIGAAAIPANSPGIAAAACPAGMAAGSLGPVWLTLKPHV